MKNFKSLLSLCLLALCTTVIAKKSEQDPLLGVWVGTINTPNALPNEQAYFALTINPEGTITASTTLGNQQAVTGFPGGVYGSEQHGYWKKVGKRCYKIATTEVVNFKDLSNPIFPGIPLYRPLIEYTVKLSKDGKTFSYVGQESFFEIADETFTHSIIDPTTGKPLVIPFTGTATRFYPKGLRS